MLNHSYGDPGKSTDWTRSISMVHSYGEKLGKLTNYLSNWNDQLKNCVQNKSYCKLFKLKAIGR